MQVQQNTLTTVQETVGSKAENVFTVKASATMFSILSEKLYANPLESTMVELLSNAYDAHLEKGQLGKRKIDIHFPSTLNEEFYVRDYGNGMSDDFILKAYTSFGESTKQGDNTYVGGFGIGSKSPFSCVNSFTVTSYQKGLKSVFIMDKNGGLPTCTQMVKGAHTDEEDGVKVSFTYKTLHHVRSTFTDSLRLFWLRKHHVNVVNDGKDNLPYTYEDELFSIYEGDSCLPDTCVRIGCVCYPSNTIYHRSSIYPLIMRCEVGSVSLTPSREKIIDSAENRNHIISLEKVYKEDVSKQSKLFLEKCKKEMKKGTYPEDEKGEPHLSCLLLSDSLPIKRERAYKFIPSRLFWVVEGDIISSTGKWFKWFKNNVKGLIVEEKTVDEVLKNVFGSVPVNKETLEGYAFFKTTEAEQRDLYKKSPEYVAELERARIKRKMKGGAKPRVKLTLEDFLERGAAKYVAHGDKHKATRKFFVTHFMTSLPPFDLPEDTYVVLYIGNKTDVLRKAKSEGFIVAPYNEVTLEEIYKGNKDVDEYYRLSNLYNYHTEFKGLVSDFNSTLFYVKRLPTLFTKNGTFLKEVEKVMRKELEEATSKEPLSKAKKFYLEDNGFGFLLDDTKSLNLS
jgi:hypothetical protein